MGTRGDKLKSFFFFGQVPYMCMKTNTIILSADRETRSPYCDYSWWYLHGKLMEMVGYDKAVIVGGLSKSDIRLTPDWVSIDGSKITGLASEKLLEGVHLNGIYPIKIEDIEEPCIGYFWTTKERFVTWEDVGYSIWKQRGLVVLESDTESNENARIAYEEKREKL